MIFDRLPRALQRLAVAVHDHHRCGARSAHPLSLLSVHRLCAWLPIWLVRVLGADLVVELASAVLRLAWAPRSVALFLLHP